MVKLVLLALLALSSGLKLSDKQEFDYDHLQSSIVRIQTVGASFDWFRPFNPQDGQVSLGSGFIVQTEPYILIATNQHVINDALRVQVQLLLHSQMKWDVQIVSACPKFDLALLTLKDDQGFKATLRKAHLEVQPLILSQHVAEMGEDVVALGFPLGQNSLKISKGNVAGNEIVSNNLCIQSTAPISPGNSGGPLLDTAGKEVLGVNFAGATRGENINYVIPAFRVQALINLHLKEQQSPPWIRGGFKTPGHGLVIIHPNEALYNYSEGCKEGVFVGRVHDDGFMSKAKPSLQEGSMLLSVAGRPLDRFSKADIKDLMHGKAALEDLFFIQSDLKSEVSFQSCLKGKITDHKVNTSKTPDFDQGIVFVDEPVTDGWTQQYEIFGDVGVMAMTQNHVAEAFARSGSPKITRWLLPERAIKPRLMITYVRPGSYASEILAEGSAVEKVNGKLVRTLEEWREALVPDSGSIWTLETDLGILLASPFKETLSTQLQRGKVDAYLLTQGIEQANEKLSNASAATTSTTAERIVVEEETMEVSTTSKPQKEAAGWFDWFQLMEEESGAAKRPISGEFLRHVSMMQLDTPRAAGPLKVSRRKGALVVEGSHAEKCGAMTWEDKFLLLVLWFQESGLTWDPNAIANEDTSLEISTAWSRPLMILTEEQAYGTKQKDLNAKASTGLPLTKAPQPSVLCCFGLRQLSAERIHCLPPQALVLCDGKKVKPARRVKYFAMRNAKRGGYVLSRSRLEAMLQPYVNLAQPWTAPGQVGGDQRPK